MSDYKKAKQVKVKAGSSSNKISWKQVAILVGVGGFLLLILFIRTGGNIFKGGKVLGTQSEYSSLTYEQLEKEYSAKEQEQIDTTLDQFAKDVALIDPDAGNGKVLGITDDPNGEIIPKADQVFSKETLEKIKVKVVPDNQDNFRTYSENKFLVETHYNVIEFINALSASDSFSLEQTRDQSIKVVQELKGMSVPSKLVGYHRYVIVYYLLVNQMAVAALSENGDEAYETNGILFMSVVQRIESDKQKLSEELGLSL